MHLAAFSVEDTCLLLPSDDPEVMRNSDLPNLLTVLTASITEVKCSLSSKLTCGIEHELILRNLYRQENILFYFNHF